MSLQSVRARVPWAQDRTGRYQHTSEQGQSDRRTGTTEQCVRAQKCFGDDHPLGTVPTTPLDSHKTTKQPVEDRQRMELGYEQQEAFTKIKIMVTSATTLAYSDPNKLTTVSADASSYGIGCVLLQESDGKQHPVAFCSRTLTPTEQQYAHIEKECLACVWSCEKYMQYLRGLHSFRLITDHKSMVPLIGEKDLNMVPLRCQRLLMRMMWFNPKSEYVPGKQLVVADLLSRKPLRESVEAITLQLEEDVSL